MYTRLYNKKKVEYEVTEEIIIIIDTVETCIDESNKPKRT